jgi:outer membrane protein TolC
MRTRWPIWALGCVLLVAGCQHLPHDENPVPPRRVHQPVLEGPACPAAIAGDGKPVPICLDTVLRLAQDKNGQVRLARMKVADAETDQDWANKRWLPDLSAGMAAYHHDGGIQDFQGNLIRSTYNSAIAGFEITGKYDPKELLFRRIEAERRVWTHKGELSKLTSENLLDASTTYIDLLSARTGIVVSMETEVRLNELLEQAKALAKVDPGSNVEVSRIETELMAQTVLTVKLREACKAATAKLAYLIGLDPCCEFIVADKKLVPIHLIDAGQPTPVLVEYALTRGPGVRELEGLLHSVEAARATNYGWSHWMPSIELNMVEGGFGASPAGQDFAWANRFDMGVHMKWSLSEFVYAKQRRHQADANIEQVHLSYQDLRSKLTLGVQEARDAILSGHEQIQLAERHINYAEESYRLSSLRLKEGIKNKSTSEVLLALRSLGGARLEYLQAVRDLNKANLRLFILVGAMEPGVPDGRVDCPARLP